MTQDPGRTAVRSTPRRSLIAGGLLLGGATFAPSIVRAQARSLVISLYGGVYEKHFKEAVIAPFDF